MYKHADCVFLLPSESLCRTLSTAEQGSVCVAGTSCFFVPCGIFMSPYLGKAQQPQEQRYPVLSVYAVFSGVQTLVWLLVSGICKVCTDVDACNCTQGLYGHCKRACTEILTGRKMPCYTRDSNLHHYCA